MMQFLIFLMGKRELAECGPYDINIIGDYNIGGDAWASRILLEEMGLRVIAQWSGDGTINELAIAHKVKLNLIHCHRFMNYIVTTMERDYGILWLEYNFFGPTKTAESLRAIAALFDEHIQENCEKVIAKYTPQMEAIISKFKPRLEGDKVMLLVGDLRARHTLGAYELEELAQRLDIDLMGLGVKKKYVCITRWGFLFGKCFLGIIVVLIMVMMGLRFLPRIWIWT